MSFLCVEESGSGPGCSTWSSTTYLAKITYYLAKILQGILKKNLFGAGVSRLLTLQCDNSEFRTSMLSCILTVLGSVQPMGWAAGQMSQGGLEASTRDFLHSYRAGYHSDRPNRPWALSSFSAVPFWVHTSLGLLEYPGPSGKRTKWCWPRLFSAERQAPLEMVVTGRQTDICGARLLLLGSLGGKRRKRKYLCRDTKQTRG